MYEPRWYVVHTYSGYENKVKANIEKIVENRKLHNEILEVVVPLQDTVEIKSGQRKNVTRKVFPGYVLLKMIMNDDTWYVVRNTRGVTSFVGPGSKPVPLEPEEVSVLGIENTAHTIDLNEGDSVRVTDGPFADSIGVVKEIHLNKGIAIVLLSVFGRDTPVELEFTKILQLTSGRGVPPILPQEV
ncbi:MAG: transcription termination/antitermination protein NusG [Defluviitaleaceae bacterium]|nr:transcription termination/antitermination protein NusG [Defluviitaleaceae bacterium]